MSEGDVFVILLKLDSTDFGLFSFSPLETEQLAIRLHLLERS